MTTMEVLKKALDALQAASDHLDYTGYGDSWERECANESKLPEQIEEALKLLTETVNQGELK